MAEVTGGNNERLVIYSAVAKIHIACINRGFLPSLGERFLTLLYESIDADPNSALFIERIDGEVVGFVAGGCGMRSVYNQMFRRLPRLILVLLPVLFSPKKLKRVLEIVWFSSKQKFLPDCPKAELFSLAVKNYARGSGVAFHLYKELMQFFSENGEPAFCIVVGDSLDSAHRFYKHMGALPLGKIVVHGGQSSTLYRHDLKGTIT